MADVTALTIPKKFVVIDRSLIGIWEKRIRFVITFESLDTLLIIFFNRIDSLRERAERERERERAESVGLEPTKAC